MRIADYIFQFLKEKGTEYVFLVVGGGAMYLNDAIKKSGIKYICFHHEQAAAIAAEGYARVSGKLGVVCVTSGPGGLNTLTGVMGQWTDSVPVLYLSGQVMQETLRFGNLRQFGDQEVDIIEIVKPITKYAVIIRDSKNVKFELEKAVNIATHERFGPVWIDLPLDIQQSLC